MATTLTAAPPLTRPATPPPPAFAAAYERWDTERTVLVNHAIVATREGFPDIATATERALRGAETAIAALTEDTSKYLPAILTERWLEHRKPVVQLRDEAAERAKQARQRVAEHEADVIKRLAPVEMDDATRQLRASEIRSALRGLSADDARVLVLNAIGQGGAADEIIHAILSGPPLVLAPVLGHDYHTDIRERLLRSRLGGDSDAARSARLYDKLAAALTRIADVGIERAPILGSQETTR